MSGLWRTISDNYHDFMDNCSDPRVQDFAMMGSPWPTVAIVAGYILFVKYLGPKFMENRKPYKLKKVLIFYNLLEIVISVIALEEAYAVGWFTTYSWTCQPIDRRAGPESDRLLRGIWLYYLSKFVELFDTVFFVLRKKDNQVSKLHVYHHSVMPLITWVTAKFVPGGHATFGGVMNSFVHVIMYSYYLLAALGPGMKKYLWWKKYLTVLQMGQFVVIFLHMMQLLFNDCDFPRPFVYFTLFQAFFFLMLFKNFYDTAYQERKQKIAVAVSEGNDTQDNPAVIMKKKTTDTELTKRSSKKKAKSEASR